MNKEVVVHRHNGIYSGIKRNTFQSVLMRWMNLEPIIRTEVRKRKTNTIYLHIYIESRKVVQMILRAGQQKRHM